MKKRHTDNTIHNNKVDFVIRRYGLSVAKLSIFLIIPLLFILVLYVFNIYDSYINIIINCIFTSISILAISIQIKQYLRTIASIEYQNMIFANALNHNTEFCLIIKNNGEIVYADARFYERFIKNQDKKLDLPTILKLGNISNQEIELFNNALKNKSSIHTYFSLNTKNKTSNFTLILDPVVENPEIEVNCTKITNLFFTPIARPQEYFVLKAVKISKEQVYERLIQEHCVGAYLLNSRGVILHSNNSFLKMLELDFIENGATFTNFLVKSYNKEKTTDSNIVNLLTATGVKFKAYISQVAFYDKNNQSYIYGLLTPINSGIHDYHLHPCFMEAPIAILQCNTDGKIIKSNNTLKRLVKHNKEYIYDYVLPSYNKKIKKYLENNIVKDLSLEAQLHNNSYVKIYFNKFIHNNDMLIICYIIDSKDRKNLEIQLEQSQKMQAIGQLAGGIAHDFNNILTAIIGFCDLLLIKHSTTDPSFSDIMQIKQNANRATNLIKQLLAFSRKQTLQPKILDINNIIADLIHMIKRLINESIELKIQYEQNINLIKADLCQLEQVIINLVVNARSAMETGGQLTIKTYNIKADALKVLLKDMFSPDKEQIEDGEYVAIEISDTGHGMEEKVMKKIFDPFFSTKKTTEGIGLGLSTVYGIVKQTDGYIYVTSTIGIGTTFIILLPTVHLLHNTNNTNLESNQDSEYIGAVTQEINNTTKNILLIEDEDPVRIFATKALVKKGFNVIDINCGDKAIDIIKNQNIDIVISDVVMPKISGPEIIDQILKIQPNIKVIFISGYAEEVFNKHSNIDASKINFLSKPFTLKQLTEKVSEILGSFT
ncbi:response regulator [Ehrlichia ruminantium]|uniref:histidine kinase n=1 Tax=Ehrlichia ruminantium (strain Welgevonden) TaxID=254945 RepID=A0A0H3M5Y0_EHRRW|nr:response regulator [Ehrlichia ruminantium]KYW93293.1 hybrid sensor histidine kinase/response regulator [Ehrlichia ruminantium]QLK55011.1 response regulator [Ehrlichia ruminantium]QLK55929.1 response regulator [Ehrlichia ruminantium]UOD99116.1 response regulator [Ehrlichia ruminantium]CAH58056.1 putative two component sensor kinase [Ehrlichia ruminantium str. Welgevonden]